MSSDPPKETDPDLTNAARLHGKTTPATARVEKAVLGKIREYEQKKALDKKFEQSQEKENEGQDGPSL